MEGEEGGGRRKERGKGGGRREEEGKGEGRGAGSVFRLSFVKQNHKKLQQLIRAKETRK